jgi:hypothetical protein
MEARGHIHLEVAEFRLDRGVISASLKPGQIKGRSVLMPDTVSYYRTNLNRMKYGTPTSHRPCRARHESATAFNSEIWVTFRLGKRYGTRLRNRFAALPVTQVAQAC